MADAGQNSTQHTFALTSGGKTSRVLKKGDIIGDSYRVKAMIGRGGMGYVFRVDHIIIGQDYALKMLAPDQFNEIAWKRFQSEGKAIARLDHPNIVKIYNMGVDQGDYPYYVMDLLDGMALSDCIKDEMEFSIDEIIDIFIQLTSGFGYAHSHGIIHRDVKPSNVVLLDGGGPYPVVKIVDFGIAKQVGGADLHSQSLTATGEIFGSPYYMSPEQCLGSEIDHRADIYSLGCALFETLCGHPPFMGESAMQTVMMHQSQPSPTIESVSGKYAGTEMEEIVAKMLMKRPADRYQSMDQVRHDLERIRQNKAVGKNVDTGFKSAMDSQLEAMGAGYEEEKIAGARQRRLLIVYASVVVGFAAVIFAAVTVIASRPTEHTNKADFRDGLVTTKQYTTQFKQADRRVFAAGDELDAVTSITSTMDRAKGERVFHCPNINLGQFVWFSGPKTKYGLDTNSADDGKVVANGEARVPSDELIYLKSNVALNRETWMHAGILSKFGPTELCGLILTVTVKVSEVGSAADAQIQGQKVTELIEAIRGWTNCQLVELHGVEVPDQALIALDQQKSLQRFVARDTGLNSEVLAKRKFLHHLSSIELAKEDVADSVLCAFKGSPNIRIIDIEAGHITRTGVEALIDCPHLEVLVLHHGPTDDQTLKAIAMIKSLKALKIDSPTFKIEQMPLLEKLSHLDKLDVILRDWPSDVRAAFRKRVPCAQLPEMPPLKKRQEDD